MQALHSGSVRSFMIVTKGAALFGKARLPLQVVRGTSVPPASPTGSATQVNQCWRWGGEILGERRKGEKTRWGRGQIEARKGHYQWEWHHQYPTLYHQWKTHAMSAAVERLVIVHARPWTTQAGELMQGAS